jgi:hypothetical protein
VHELIELVKSMEYGGYRYPAGTSYKGNSIPKPNVTGISDFILLHGNKVGDPERISKMVEQTRKVEGYRDQPILFNEDDHYSFNDTLNNFVMAVQSYASWGYFDYRREGEPFEDGFQSVPVDWGINSGRKKAFFNMVREITGGF